MKPSVPVNLNLSRNTKLVNELVVAKNSFSGTVALSDPPTNAPSSMRHVLFVSPSQPLNVLPSKVGTALLESAALSAVAEGEIVTAQSPFFRASSVYVVHLVIALP